MIDGNLSLGDFTAFYTYLVMLAGPLRMLGVAMGMAQRAIASGNRLFEILDREPQIESAARRPAAAGRRRQRRSCATSACATSSRAASTLPTSTRPRWGRGRSRRWRESTSRSRPGRTVALVGPSGSGKTSLVALIARLYDPSEGAVLVDGVDVREVEVESLRSEIAFVADDSFLFTASVAENIAYARPEASLRGDRSRPRAAPRPTPSSASCPTATRPGSASAA